MRLNGLSGKRFRMLFYCLFIFFKVKGNGWMRVAVNRASSSISTGSIWGGGGWGGQSLRRMTQE